jgi:hypothetical protein
VPLLFRSNQSGTAGLAPGDSSDVDIIEIADLREHL